MHTIALFDPSLPTENYTDSDNFGDVIIADSTKSILAEIFPSYEIIRLPTKRSLSRNELNALRSCKYAFLGGTNILNGDIKSHNQWKIDTSIIGIVCSQIAGVIAMGVGWEQYQDRTTILTSLFYKRIFHHKLYHAARDKYTFSKFVKSGIQNVINTSCPTVWGLDGRSTRRRLLSTDAIVFMLTDYRQSEDRDNKLITILLEHSTGKLLFFPQGSRDIEYVESLNTFKNNRDCICILPREMRELNNLASDSRITYVGTRLHGGIRFLQSGRDALIISVDNRAAEIYKDIRLPVATREDLGEIIEWLRGKLDFGIITLPTNQIQQWKSQFLS